MWSEELQDEQARKNAVSIAPGRGRAPAGAQPGPGSPRRGPSPRVPARGGRLQTCAPFAGGDGLLENALEEALLVFSSSRAFVVAFVTFEVDHK